MSILALERKQNKKENSQSKSGRKQKRKKIPNQKSGRKQKRKKIPNQRGGESKKEEERKFPIKDWKKTEEICRKVFGPNNI